MRRRSRLRAAAMFVASLAILTGIWEGYKAIGRATDDKVLGWKLPAHTDDLSMPHVWDILQRLGRDENRAIHQSVARSVAEGAWFTFRIALAGLIIGTLIGLALAVLMQRFKIVERAIQPYLVLSQTVPLVALAPLVVGWGGQLHLGSHEWKPWMSVSLIAAYLAFFPVAIGALRGLKSPPAHAVELMQSYAASWRQTLFKLRFPAAVPHLVPALRLAAASSIVGAIVGEISTGTKGGIGRLILEYSREATSDPAKVFTAMIGAAALGLLVAGLVALLDSALMRHRPALEATA